jgi:SP family general alpha glucoside:H+ symporter-like MFS transporter
VYTRSLAQKLGITLKHSTSGQAVVIDAIVYSLDPRGQDPFPIPPQSLSKMATATVTTTHQAIDITESTPERLELVRRAQEADIAEHGLTIRQALKRYKKAVAWALALSVCLVMDGYDVSCPTTTLDYAKT